MKVLEQDGKYKVDLKNGEIVLECKEGFESEEVKKSVIGDAARKVNNSYPPGEGEIEVKYDPDEQDISKVFSISFNKTLEQWQQ